MINWKRFGRSSRGLILMYRPSTRLEALRNITEPLSQESRSPDRHLNPGHSKYEAWVLSTQPRRSVKRQNLWHHVFNTLDFPKRIFMCLVVVHGWIIYLTVNTHNKYIKPSTCFGSMRPSSSDFIIHYKVLYFIFHFNFYILILITDTNLLDYTHL
jgi:hypothetical protein